MLPTGSTLKRRVNPAEPDSWEVVRVGRSGVEGCISIRPVDAIAGGIDVDERELLEVYDVEALALVPGDDDEPRLSWWVS